jgi:hypothetical protein
MFVTGRINALYTRNSCLLVTTQIHLVNTTPRCGVYNFKQKTKLSNNIPYSNNTRGCNTYIRDSQTPSQTLPP